MPRRFRPTPPIKMAFWKAEGKLWYAEPKDLLEAIEASGHSHKLIQTRMGAGYHYIQDILDGKRIDGWAVCQIEWGLSPEREGLNPHSWPPIS